ncbi:alpha-glucosidase C-terminal domain-containing protein, partial [Acinetobacter baumannii]|nr:alpha-glucosidase C-terminal domain-containing protein [Acinetobacter baumannii]
IMAVTSRDNARTPMQWDATQNAGFTKGTPWINVADNYNYINVEKELKSEDSILNFYKKMIKLKKESLTLTYGKYELILADDENIYAYERILEEEKYIIITNLSEKNVKYSYNKAILNSSKLLLSNYNVQEHGDITECDLRPYEARLYKVK